jgi:CHAT domain-containing protein/tetratricopeptide (TPR) repeat protein
MDGMRIIKTVVAAVLATSLFWSTGTASQSQSPPAGQPPPSQTPLQQTLAEAQVFRARNDFRSSLPLFAKAIELAEQAHDDDALVQALSGHGDALWGAGDYAGSVADCERALGIARFLGAPERESLLLNDIGNSLYNLGRYDEALESFQQALATNQRAPSLKTEGLIRSNIGLVFRYTGRLKEARAAFEEAVVLRREANDLAGVGQSFNNLGIVTRAMGLFDESLDYYRQSLALRRQLGERQGEAQVLFNLGNVLLDLGETGSALENYTTSLEIAEAINYRAQIGFSNGGIGEVLESLGRPREAVGRYETALSLYRDINRRPQIAEALDDVGRLRLSLNELPAARAAFTEALDLARAIKEPEREALTLQALGNLALVEQDATVALARQDEALAIARRVGAPGIEWEVLADRARALRALDRPDEAIDGFHSAAAIVNDLRANVRSDSNKVGLFDSRRQVFYRLAETLVAVGRTDEALEAAEASRARAFADLLSQRNVGLKPVDRVGLENVRTAAALAGAPAGNRHDEPSGTRSGSLDAALASLASTRRELASLITVDSPSIGEIRDTARRLRATLVEYMVSDRQLFIWVVRPDGAVHAATVEATSNRVQQLTQDVRGGMGLTTHALERRERLGPRLRELHHLLVDPIASWLPASADEVVIVIPDGPLAYVPFAALEDSSGEPFIARHVLASAPSASVYRYTPGKATAPDSLSALVVADPRPPRDSHLAALPWSRVEAREVTRQLGQHVLLLEGPRATEAAIKRLSPDYAVLHFATHGLISTDRPLASSLAFADGDDEDGYLQVSEVFGMDLHARLVVLSGCSTGLGRLSSDGFLGLTRAFIFAGTPTVLVSQWDVSDRATSVLMGRFYFELRRGRSTAQALRLAVLATRKRFPHPALWAAFEVVGEPR